MKYVNNPLYPENYYKIKILILAQQGNVKGIREVIKNNYVSDVHKAKVFAILEERDSMYYYIDKLDVNNSFWEVFSTNGSKEFDPYRKEERYKAFLKRNYYPIITN